MPLPPVVVELGDAPLTPELRQTLLRACTRSVEEGECVDATGATPNESRAVVILSWGGDGNVRIQVGLREPTRWRSRTLHFAAEDDLVEICTAVGFAAGTLATTLSLGQEAGEEIEPPPGISVTDGAAEGPPKPPPPPPKPPSARSTARAAARTETSPRPALERPRPVRITADLTALAATGVERNAPRLGPRASLALWGAGGWTLEARADVAWVARPPLGMTYRVTGGAVGAGGSLARDALRASARLYLGVNRLEATATNPATQERDEASRWLGLSSLGGELEWPCTQLIRPLVTGEVAWPFGTTDIVVAGSAREVASRLHLAAALGLRVGASCAAPRTP
jgi:hypothetical protein